MFILYIPPTLPELTEIVSDEGVSGSVSIGSREGGSRLLAAIQVGHVEHVVGPSTVSVGSLPMTGWTSHPLSKPSGDAIEPMVLVKRLLVRTLAAVWAYSDHLVEEQFRERGHGASVVARLTALATDVLDVCRIAIHAE